MTDNVYYKAICRRCGKPIHQVNGLHSLFADKTWVHDDTYKINCYPIQDAAPDRNTIELNVGYKGYITY